MLVVKHECYAKLSVITYLKDVPTSIPKSDLLGVTMSVIHVAGQQIILSGRLSKNWLYYPLNSIIRQYCANGRGNWPYRCEIRLL